MTNLGIGVTIGAAATVFGAGFGAATIANHLDRDGSANRKLTVGLGAGALLSAAGAGAMYLAAKPGGGNLNLAIYFVGFSALALGLGGLAAGSLGADLLNVGQH